MRNWLGVGNRELTESGNNKRSQRNKMYGGIGRTRQEIRKLETRNTPMRHKLEDGDRGDFIIDSPQHAVEIEKKKGISPSRYRDVGNSGIEINGDNEARKEEFGLGETVEDSQLGGSKLCHNGNQL